MGKLLARLSRREARSRWVKCVVDEHGTSCSADADIEETFARFYTSFCSAKPLADTAAIEAYLGRIV